MLKNKIKEELKRRLEEGKDESKKSAKVLIKTNDPNISLLLRQVVSMNQKINVIKKEVDFERGKRIEEKRKNFKEVFVGVNRTGYPVQVHYDNGKVKVWTEKGLDITENIPSIVRQFAVKKEEGIIIGNLDWYHNGKLMPHSNTAKIVERKKSILEKEIKLMISDKLYSVSPDRNLGDIHKESYSFRKKELSKMSESKNIKIFKKEFLAGNEKELKTFTKKLYSFVSSSGITLKPAGNSFDFVKYSGQIERQEGKEIMFKIADFQKGEKTILSSEIKFPYRFKTVAFSEGKWHETDYNWDVIKEGAPRILNSSLVTFHVGDNDTILTEVGRIVDFELDEQTKQLIVDCEVFDTSAGKDIAILHANKRIPAVSVRLTEDSEFGVCKKIIAWPHVAIVREGEVSDAKPCYDGICQR